MTYSSPDPRLKRAIRLLSAASIALAVLIADLAGFPSFVSGSGEAQARMGAPWTPLSVGGAARRAAVRRSTIYVNTLPAACSRLVVNGVTVWSCGGVYYQRYQGRYVVVFIR